MRFPLAIICPPSAKPAATPDGSGYKYSSNQFGTYVGRSRQPRDHGWSKWLLKSDLYQGHTSLEFARLWLAYIAAMWPHVSSSQLSAYTAMAAGGPATNIKGQLKTFTPFQTWMFEGTLARWNYLLSTLPAYLFPWPPVNYFFAVSTTPDWDMTAPTTLTIASDMTITATFAAPYYTDNRPLIAYITPPGVETYQPTKLHAVWNFIGQTDRHFWILDGSKVRQILRPFPNGSDVLLGIRTGAALNGTASKLIVVNATVGG